MKGKFARIVVFIAILISAVFPAGTVFATDETPVDPTPAATEAVFDEAEVQASAIESTPAATGEEETQEQPAVIATGTPSPNEIMQSQGQNRDDGGTETPTEGPGNSDGKDGVCSPANPDGDPDCADHNNGGCYDGNNGQKVCCPEGTEKQGNSCVPETTETASPSPTPTSTSTATPSVTPSVTNTPVTATPTASPTGTATGTATATNTPQTSTPTIVPTATTAVPTATTAVPTLPTTTATSTSTATPSVTPSLTNTPEPSQTPTFTPPPVSTEVEDEEDAEHEMVKTAKTSCSGEFIITQVDNTVTVIEMHGPATVDTWSFEISLDGKSLNQRIDATNCWIYFNWEVTGENWSDLYMIDLHGHNLINITDKAGVEDITDEYDPAAGTQLAFTSSSEGGTTVDVASLFGNSRKTVADSAQAPVYNRNMVLKWSSVPTSDNFAGEWHTYSAEGTATSFFDGKFISHQGEADIVYGDDLWSVSYRPKGGFAVQVTNLGELELVQINEDQVPVENTNIKLGVSNASFAIWVDFNK